MNERNGRPVATEVAGENMNMELRTADALVPQTRAETFNGSVAAWHDSDPAMMDSEGGAKSGGMSPALVWHTWRRWWPWCLPVGAALAVLGVALTWLSFKPMYEAQAWLQISAPEYFVFAHNQSGAGAQSDVFVRTQLALIESPVVLDRVVARPEIGKIAEIRTSLNPVKELSDQLDIESIDQSELYQVSFSASVAADAMTVVNAVLDEYVKVYEQEGQTRREQITVELKSAKDERRVELTNLRGKVRMFAQQLTGEESPALDASNISAQIDSPLPELNSQLSESEFERLVLEARLKTLLDEVAGYQPVITESEVRMYVQGDPEYQRQSAIVEELQRRFSESEATLKPGAADAFLAESKKRVEQAKAELEAIDKRVTEQGTEVLTLEKGRNSELSRLKEIDELQAQVQAKKLGEKMLVERINKYRETHKGAGAAAVELEFARGDLARVEQVYNLLLNRINEIETENRAPSRVEVLRQASLPSAPKELLPWRKFAVAACAAMLAPFALAFLWEFRTQRVTAGEQLSGVGTMPLFAEITSLPTRPRLSNAHAEKGFLIQRAAFEDSVHYLCRNMILSAGQDLRVVAVTSAVSGEGKTSLSAQLAISLAQCCQEPVVLVDADVRAPDMHEIYDVPLCPGLTGVMLGECDLPSAIRATSMPNVYVLPAGQAKSHPHLLLHQGRLETLLAELRRDYRYVVLDTPPVLAVGESLSVCAAADGVLICALRDVSRQPQIKLLQQRLRSAGAKALGVVLGGVSSRMYTSRYGEYAYEPPVSSS
jgi:succinoglycan biosynthesis transport protein ExoP